MLGIWYKLCQLLKQYCVEVKRVNLKSGSLSRLPVNMLWINLNCLNSQISKFVGYFKRPICCSSTNLLTIWIKLKFLLPFLFLFKTENTLFKNPSQKWTDYIYSIHVLKHRSVIVCKSIQCDIQSNWSYKVTGQTTIFQ